jgi:hypothetical protein
MELNRIARVLVSALAAGGLLWAVSGPISALPTSDHHHPSPFYGPHAHPNGHSFGEWSARFWEWGMELPLAGHPFLETNSFDVTAGQSGNVWFLGAPLVFDSTSSVTRSVTIPHGKKLFFPLLAGEISSLEGFPTEQEQRETAVWQADHFVPESLFCTLDGVALTNPTAYRFESPQLSFNAPTPWIFGDTGGAGTAVGDGYYVFLKPLHHGQHTLRFGGRIHFTFAEDGFDFDAWVNMTYHINQSGGHGGGGSDDDDD